MNRSQLTELHRQVCDKARGIQIRKNHDYAHDLDIFRNFRRYGTFGVLVRLSDKLARLDSFEENKEFAVTDEKLEDTIMDIINYATIYLAMKRETEPGDYPPMTAEVRAILDGCLAGGASAPGSSRVKVTDGPYCDYCERLATFRLDENNCDTRYFCERCTHYLQHREYASCTRMEKA